MKIPVVGAKKAQRTMIRKFGGYDIRSDASAGSFVNMRNLTGKNYPKLSTRDMRSVIDLGGQTVYNITVMDIYHNGKIRKNALIADCENRLKAFYEENGEYKWHDLFNTSSVLTQGKKSFAVAGTKVYFFPDKMYYDLMSGSVGALEFHTSYVLGENEDGYLYEIAFEPCDLLGENSDETSSYRRIRRRCYKITNGEAEETPSKYLSFSSSVSEGDTVKLRGLSDNDLNGYYNIKKISPARDIMVIECSKSYAQSAGTVYIDREVPEMDYVISSGNRLWGCRYGTDAYGNCVNEIYASSLNDAKNWHKHLGVSTDSWSTSIGLGGGFTGAVCMDGNPVFFKEDAIIKVFGSYPSEFTVSETQARGIEAGSDKSAVFVNDDLYYKTYSGIVRYSGGMPVNVDGALGDIRYKNAVAGTVDDRYFVSMENSDGECEMFVYDTVRNLWHKEDSINVISFARAGGDLYFLSESDGKSLLCSVIKKEGCSSEGNFNWMCETVKMGCDLPERKFVSNVQINLESGDNTVAEVFIEYNGDERWHFVAAVGGKVGSSFLRIRPRRCDFFRLRVEGEGEFSVTAITSTVEKSSTLEVKGR